jgi:hypothetical protein
MFLVELSDGHRIIGDELTRSSLLHLPSRHSKNRQYFGHDLRHYIRYRRSRRDFCMDLEAGEEAFDPVEEFDKRFPTCGSILRCLRRCVSTALQRYHAIKLTTRRILIPENMILMGGNT